jgi:hypothetical protein
MPCGGTNRRTFISALGSGMAAGGAWTAGVAYDQNLTANFHYSLGEYDGFVILDAPDEATVSAFVLAAIAPGHINATKTTVLMTPGAMFDAMKKASLAGYRGPRK